jgi:hypothetical protein
VLPLAELAAHPAKTLRERWHTRFFSCAKTWIQRSGSSEEVKWNAKLLTNRRGRIAMVKLPNGGEIGLYQPYHLWFIIHFPESEKPEKWKSFEGTRLEFPGNWVSSIKGNLKI